MRRARLQIGCAVVCLVTVAAGRAEAGLLVEYTGGGSSGALGYFGESVTTPIGGPFDHITFNYFSDVPATTPLAAGDLFILTQAYSGTPNNLSSSTPGFLAESTGISGGIYQFATSLTLQSSTQYFFYVDTPVAATFGNPGGYAGGIWYLSTNGLSSYGPINSGDVNFRLSGTAVGAAVPEPSSALSALGGAVGLLAYARWRLGRDRRSPRPADAAE